MKFGLLDYSYGATQSYGAFNRYAVNIGNNMQTLAIEYLYQRLGIESSQIIRIGYHELTTYKGEYVILPMNMYGAKDDILPLSNYIIPLFVGFNYVNGKVFSKTEFLRRYE